MIMKNSRYDIEGMLSGDMRVEDEVCSVETDELFFCDDDGDNEGAKPHRKGRALSSRIVYIVLAIDAIGFSLATYFLSKASQTKKFESEFSSFARETADIAENNAEKTFGQLKSLATAMTSIAKDSSHSFPNSTVPHFDLRAQEVADLTGAEMILWVPFVEQQHRAGWEAHAVDHQDWITQDYQYRGWDTGDIQGINHRIYNLTLPVDFNETREGFVDTDNFMEDILEGLGYNSQRFSAPIAQFGPAAVNTSLAMMDLFSHPVFKKEIVASLEYDVPVVSEIEDLEFLLQHIEKHKVTDYRELRSFTLDQVKDDFHGDAKTVGYIVGVVPWRTFFTGLLPDSINGIVVKVVSDCGQNFTYTVNGARDDWAKKGDHHDPKYDELMQQYQFFWKDHPKGTSRHCHFDLYIYPSDEFASIYTSNAPILYASIVLAAFAFTAAVFFLYDRYVQQNQRSLVSSAARAENVVTSLFPKHVGEQLMQEAEQETGAKGKSRGLQSAPSYAMLDSTESGGEQHAPLEQPKALADLYPHCTIMFADLVGFTAWSSTREPSQVFTLLETLYHSFDEVAKRRRVFKVETIGDCYVAVAGLPKPRKDHAVVMCRFARDCLYNLQRLLPELEEKLGPGTSELGLRVGLHSGPVTAGVLRGEKARFQLFGDTVNTTARIETTGAKNQVHISQETAQLISNSGKGHWLRPRKEKVVAKGKGELTTFWLDIKRNGTLSGGNESTSELLDDQVDMEPLLSGETQDHKLSRMVIWSADILSDLLRRIIAQRQAVGTVADCDAMLESAEIRILRKNGTKVEEVKEVITLPKCDVSSSFNALDHASIEVNDNVAAQLQEYVRAVASLYCNNAFHNFEHAGHVTMSTVKFLSRMSTPSLAPGTLKTPLDHTYGITSDPLTQFAVVFSALIHDIDHQGVSNAQLVKENSSLAAAYKNQSVAEQNSVDIAWHLLMEENFKDLRRTIYTTTGELFHFRRLVVNTVMATDIMDKQLSAARKARWEEAFSDQRAGEGTEITNVGKKATIVIEHLIQASDVAHTMQHWHVYRRWNERLFMEIYHAYRSGRAENNPAENWYKDEIGFFDFYVIPLAKRLKECGVFGVSCDEYLNYAEQNRREWELRGRAIVAEMINSVSANYHLAQELGWSCAGRLEI